MSEYHSHLLALTPYPYGRTVALNRWQHLKAQHQQFGARWEEKCLKELHKRRAGHGLEYLRGWRHDRPMHAGEQH